MNRYPITQLDKDVAQSDTNPLVLIVDDEQIIRRLLHAWLEEQNYPVCSVSSGEEALARIPKDHSVIVVTDWNMPGMSGVQLCRAIRSRDQAGYAYLLMVTSRESQKDVVEAIDAGADDFLSKPVDRKELVCRVRQGDAALRRFRRSVEVAELDPLTGAMNRRRFQEYCVREIAKTARDGEPLSCLLLDIDHFKQINDSHGHTVGDAAIQRVGELLRDMTRATDFVCRYGGDEFCVLLPGSDEPHAIAFAERVRNAMKNTPVEANGCSVTMKMTAGVAQWREDLITPRRLIDLADEALLAAKRVGRDRVLGYAQLHRISNDDTGHPKDAKQFHGVLAADVMTSPIVTVRAKQTIGEVAELFISLNTNALPVVDGRGRLVGLISEKDVLNAVESSEEWMSPVTNFMNRRVVTFDEMDPAVDVWEFMRHVTMRRIVIVRDRVPVGVVSRGTLLRWLKNWDSVLPRRGQLQTPGARNTLSQQVHRLAEDIADEAMGLQQNASDTDESLVPSIICTATRLQDNAQDLLTLSRAVQPPPLPCVDGDSSDVQPPLAPCPELPSQPSPPTVPQ